MGRCRVRGRRFMGRVSARSVGGSRLLLHRLRWLFLLHLLLCLFGMCVK